MKIDERKIHSAKARPGEAGRLQEDAQRLAIAALGFLAGDEERLERFLALSGLGADDLRAAAQEAGFLGGVMDYVASEEPLLLAFANHQACDPASVMQARQILSGEAADMP